MQIRSFSAVHPPVERVAQVACPPYDVVSRAEATQLAAGNPHSYLHVSRSEIDLPDLANVYADEVYQKAAENIAAFYQRGDLVQDAQPGIFLYQQQRAGQVQTGVVAVCAVEEYERNLIKKHEKTRQAPEEDRTRHIRAARAQGGPVFLAYREQAAIRQLMNADQRAAPLFDFVAHDGTRHIVWRVASPEKYEAAFRSVPEAYIADGHHRAASACRVAREQRADPARPEPQREAEWFLAVLFPGADLNILPYNRYVRDLNGMDTDSFMAAVRKRFTVTKSAKAAPSQAGEVSMYLAGSWYSLSWQTPPNADLLATLDCNVLQENLLAPVLGIENPRENPRIEFVGGIRGTAPLEQRVQTGGGVAFSMYPVAIEQIMAVADAGQIMPPKSTWFEPKLCSGLLIHKI